MGTVNTDIKNIVISSEQAIRYDKTAKKVIGNKYILSHIIVNSIGEFKGMSPKEVFENIEGEPIIGGVPMEPGMTNVRNKGEKTSGLNIEDTENNEGLIIYDVIVYVRTRDGLAQIILNVEAQKDEPTKYKIINRTIFYVCRLISSQKNRDFVGQRYDDIKRVYSVWICMDTDNNCLNHIHLTNDSLLGSHSWKGDIDLLNIVLIGLGSSISEKGNSAYRLHRLLGTVFSNELTPNEKMGVMEGEFEIPMEQDLKEDLDDMCNLSQGLIEKADARGEARGVAIGEARGVAIGEARGEARGVAIGEAKGIIQTALKYGIPESEIIKNVQETLHVTVQQAEEYFGKYGKTV